MLRNQKGFTLIEIIAVLVILGILAAVAIPKYLDLQTEAKKKSIDGALAAGGSNASMLFSQALLANAGTLPTMASLAGTLSTNQYTYTGDFRVSYADGGTGPTGCSGAITVTYVAGPPGGTSATYYTGTAPSKDFCMY